MFRCYGQAEKRVKGPTVNVSLVTGKRYQQYSALTYSSSKLLSSSMRV
jgi:hypothetical protein